MRLLPELKFLTYSRKTHARYYRDMPKEMTKYELLLALIGARVEFDPQEEDIDIFSQFEEETAQKVADEYNSGNFYAWFCAKVSVKYRGFESTDYLGGCSYKSEADFKNGGYYWDMVDTCVKEINREIEAHNADIQKRWDIRRAKNLVAPYDIILVQNCPKELAKTI